MLENYELYELPEPVEKTIYPGDALCPIVRVTDKQLVEIKERLAYKPAIPEVIPMPNLQIVNMDANENTIVMYDKEKQGVIMVYPYREGFAIRVEPDKNGMCAFELMYESEELPEGFTYEVISESMKKHGKYFIQRYRDNWFAFYLIQSAFLYPEEVFDINPVTKKHRIKPRKTYDRGGDDEELYTSILKAYQSHRGTAKATGTGTPHSHEYGVRGFWRHYSSGKEVWIKPHQRCVGRGEANRHEYLIAKE